MKSVTVFVPISKEQRHITHVIRRFAAMTARYLPSFAEQTFNGSRAGQCGVRLDKSLFHSWVRTKTVSGSIAAGLILGKLISEYLVFGSTHWFTEEAVQIIVQVCMAG